MNEYFIRSISRTKSFHAMKCFVKAINKLASCVSLTPRPTHWLTDRWKVAKNAQLWNNLLQASTSTSRCSSRITRTTSRAGKTQSGTTSVCTKPLCVQSIRAASAKGSSGHWTKITRSTWGVRMAPSIDESFCDPDPGNLSIYQWTWQIQHSVDLWGCYIQTGL